MIAMKRCRPRPAALSGRFAATLAIASLACGCASTTSRPAAAASPPSQEAQLEELASWMAGSFSSQEQSRQCKDYLDIRLHMARIWPGRSDGCWLYVEQAAAATADKPYRQRVYHVAMQPDGGFRSDVFDLGAFAPHFAGAWSTPEKFDHFEESQLGACEGCSIFLRRTAADVYAGSTQGDGCLSTLKGATHATSEVTISSDRLVSWDRGFDAAGKQVWGPDSGGYVFRRQASP